MANFATKKPEIVEFEQASKQLLLHLALEASHRELHHMVAHHHQPAGLPGYYRTLQEWRAPDALRTKKGPSI